MYIKDNSIVIEVDDEISDLEENLELFGIEIEKSEIQIMGEKIIDCEFKNEVGD